MKIIALTAENVKRLVAVEIKPDGSLVEITGKNGQGKTSVLDSIWWALAGAKHIQAAPIRNGQNHAKIKLDMGEIVVTRTFQREKDGEGFTTKLEVVGAVKGSPQAMLDSLLDSLAFDPLAFARMDAKERFDALKKYVPGVDFDKIAAQNSIDFSERKERNREAKQQRTLADAITIPPHTPKEKIDETELVRQLTEAGKHNADIQVRAENRKNAESTIALKFSAGESLRKEAAALIEKAESIEKEAAQLKEKLATAPPLPDPINVEELQAGIAAARKGNRLVELREKRAAHNAAADKLEAEAKAFTDKMEAREAERQKAVAGAKLPVEGLTFGDGVILMSGVPFEQASDAEQLKASCALAMAGNPQLRVIRVRDGSLLDEDSLALLGKMAEERDYQVWVERVGPGKTGFVLEDGHLIANAAEKVEVPQ